MQLRRPSHLSAHYCIEPRPLFNPSQAMKEETMSMNSDRKDDTQGRVNCRPEGNEYSHNSQEAKVR